MLKHAIQYKDELSKLYLNAICDDYFKWYAGSDYHDYELCIESNDFNIVQRVSVDKNDNIIGFMSCCVNRVSGRAYNFGILNFTKQLSTTFSKDVLCFIKDLKTNLNITKMEFLAYKGSPAELVYNKFISKHGGRIVGVKRATSKLSDGKYYDGVIYEIMREDMKF